MPVIGYTEFALIANRFNLMAEEMGRQRLELVRSRQSLQRGVAERTEELRLANEALSHGDRTRRHFFADISHELRTPLTVIRGESQFALRGGDKSPDAYKDALRRILARSEQMTRLVDDLLFIARSDTGNTRLDRKAMVLDKLVGEVCLGAQTLGQAKSITIAFHPQVSRAVVHGDDGRLRQLFLILLDNALHYSNPGSQVGGLHGIQRARGSRQRHRVAAGRSGSDLRVLLSGR
jgi:signal transduction histidine kinase